MERLAEGRKYVAAPTPFSRLERPTVSKIRDQNRTARLTDIVGPSIACMAVVLAALVLVSESQLSPQLRQATFETSHNFP
jgi:hypothetical protein